MVFYRGLNVDVSEETFVSEVLKEIAGVLFPKLLGIERRKFQEIISQRTDSLDFESNFANSYTARNEFLENASLKNEKTGLNDDEILNVISIYWLLDGERLEFAYRWSRTSKLRLCFMNNYQRQHSISMIYLRGPKAHISQERFVAKICTAKIDDFFPELLGIDVEKWTHIRSQKLDISKFREKLDSLVVMRGFIADCSRKNEINGLSEEEIKVLINVFKIFEQDKLLLHFAICWSKTAEYWDTFMKKFPKYNEFCYFKSEKTYLTEKAFVMMGLKESDDFLRKLLGISESEFANFRKYAAANYYKFRETFSLSHLSRKNFVEEMALKNILSTKLTEDEVSMIFNVFFNDKAEFLFHWLMAPGSLSDFKEHYATC